MSADSSHSRSTFNFKLNNMIPEGFRPMLACRAGEIKFPCYASPKLDGVRAVVFDGVVYSRTLKPIPNRYIQETFGSCNGLDGELILGDPTAKDAYRKTVSAVMTEDGEPDVTFWVFDIIKDGRFVERLSDLQTMGVLRAVLAVPQYLCETSDRLLELEEGWLAEGYEGAMVRDPYGPYKYGRSTEREGYLMKVKRFFDSEAIVLGVNELMHNDNPAEKSELGLTKRSSHQENLKPTGTMGSLTVKDLNSNVEFDIGTGFTAEDRIEWWKDREDLKGRIVKYKYFPTGSKDKPRFPVFLGFRMKEDL